SVRSCELTGDLPRDDASRERSHLIDHYLSPRCLNHATHLAAVQRVTERDLNPQCPQSGMGVQCPGASRDLVTLLYQPGCQSCPQDATATCYQGPHPPEA